MIRVEILSVERQDVFVQGDEPFRMTASMLPDPKGGEYLYLCVYRGFASDEEQPPLCAIDFCPSHCNDWVDGQIFEYPAA